MTRITTLSVVILATMSQAALAQFDDGFGSDGFLDPTDRPVHNM
ncbi:hypothetical protein PSQ19_12920 [Devosia algicola]|uniref:Uncharacterized protein n=1 Tax=Devosia algicola TaxID=3026418 RepID=A0ABY7YK21_9HYPH|nr:hypothetical protein [Devosia algicola]WDR01649.1 hypothetical protein PSQ19_12920 [Devosia algicola]